MLLFQDIFTGKDILTDSYKMKLVDDFVYVVEGSYVTKSGDNFSDEMFGGNPSAEEQVEELEQASSKSGFDVILNHEDLEEYNEQPTLKQFLKTLKKIIGFAKEKIPKDRFDSIFKPKMTEFFTTGPGKERFSNFQIYFSKGYITEDGDVKAAPVLIDADDTGMKSTIYYFKDLMDEVKM
ncbi:translationally-controlled tumor protein homolog [Actinia tenebrosa]|uniref:Translationally-controlled tumor protein homolog n=1 Tax=Actinia tenebrosa TaxID=6105 RepID=A0A6P8HQX1_ACTTE|nr:translationally-controlled tumor protein homolog [Actinia tenebrosa]